MSALPVYHDITSRYCPVCQAPTIHYDNGSNPLGWEVWQCVRCEARKSYCDAGRNYIPLDELKTLEDNIITEITDERTAYFQAMDDQDNEED